MNTENFIIENNDIEIAQNICKMITDNDIRNRAVADAFAANIAAKYFDNETYNIDTESGLHNIGLVLEDIDISDVYIKNNYIDVRVFFNEEAICVPESHFLRNLLPVAYMFIKVNEDLSGATVVGFISPDKIKRDNVINGCVRINEEELLSFYDIESLLVNQDDVQDVQDSDIFAFIDDSLSNKDEFYASLLNSKEGRLKLAKAAKAKEIFQFVSVVKKDTDVIVDDAESTDLELSTDSLDNDLLMGNDDSFELDATGSDEDLLPVDNTDEFQDLENFDNTDVDLLQEESSDDSLDLDNDTQIEETESIESEEVDSLDEGSLPDEGEIKLEAREVESFELPDELVEQEVDELTFVEESDDVDVLVENDDVVSQEEIEADLNDDTSLEIEATDEKSVVADKTTEEQIEEISSNDDFDFTTVVAHNDSDDILDELSKESEENIVAEEINDSENSLPEPEEPSEEQINVLFSNKDGDAQTEETQNQEMYIPKKQKGSIVPVTVLALVIILGALGYYGYSKFGAQLPVNDEVVSKDLIPAAPIKNNSQTEDAMPIESVEVTKPLVSNEGTAETIPAIEQNLDASILVSNLKVEWEIPSGYASNTSARRYLVKIGKIIQLNLKTELLLLNKPPITNKIAVEIKYNDGTKKFETVGITVSSGEKSVDAVILSAVDKALDMNLSINTNSFAKLQGNPVLIIHL